MKYDDHTLLGDALGYAALGLRVIPLHRGSKLPRIERWQERATGDPATIRRWFRDPDGNIGLLMGGGLAARDVDPRRGGEQSCRELARRPRLPAAAEAVTGSGARHYLLRLSAERSCGNVNGLRPGLDIK